MKFTKLIWLSGLAAVLAAMLLLISDVLELLVFGFENVSAIATRDVYVFIMAGVLLAALLLSLGLIGLYASQAEAAGSLGLLGFLMAFVGTVLFAGFFWAQEFFAPVVAEAAPGLLDNVPRWLYFGSVMTFSLRFGLAAFWSGHIQGPDLPALGGSAPYDRRGAYHLPSARPFGRLRRGRSLARSSPLNGKDTLIKRSRLMNCETRSEAAERVRQGAPTVALDLKYRAPT